MKPGGTVDIRVVDYESAVTVRGDIGSALIALGWLAPHDLPNGEGIQEYFPVDPEHEYGAQWRETAWSCFNTLLDGIPGARVG